MSALYQRYNDRDQRLATMDFPSGPILSRVRCIALFWLLRDSAYRDRTSRRQANNFSIAGSILSLGFFDDVVEPEPETSSQPLTDCSHFTNDRIRFHLRSPAIPVACK
jgi:hypothetical protein